MHSAGEFACTSVFTCGLHKHGAWVGDSIATLSEQIWRKAHWAARIHSNSWHIFYYCSLIWGSFKYWNRQSMYVQRNSEARSRNKFRSGKSVRITYCECVFVALLSCTQSAWAVSYCHLLPVWLFHGFTHNLTKARFFSRGWRLNPKYSFWFSLQIWSQNYLVLGRFQWEIIIHVLRASLKLHFILLRF